MAEIINLRKARKRRALNAKTEVAAENRVRFGRGKIERADQERDLDRAIRHLDEHLLDRRSRTVKSADDDGSDKA